MGPRSRSRIVLATLYSLCVGTTAQAKNLACLQGALFDPRPVFAVVRWDSDEIKLEDLLSELQSAGLDIDPMLSGQSVIVGRSDIRDIAARVKNQSAGVTSIFPIQVSAVALEESALIRLRVSRFYGIPTQTDHALEKMGFQSTLAAPRRNSNSVVYEGILPLYLLDIANQMGKARIVGAVPSDALSDPKLLLNYYILAKQRAVGTLGDFINREVEGLRVVTKRLKKAADPDLTYGEIQRAAAQAVLEEHLPRRMRTKYLPSLGSRYFLPPEFLRRAILFAKLRVAPGMTEAVQSQLAMLPALTVTKQEGSWIYIQGPLKSLALSLALEGAEFIAPADYRL